MVDREDRLTAPASGSKSRHPVADTPKKAHKKPGPQKGARRLAPDPVRDDDPDDLPPDERFTVDDTENLSDEERVAIFMSPSNQSALPTLPEIPGFHTCWLTTSSKSDSIASRLRQGYTLILARELGPQYRAMGVANGDFAGCVMINEMIAAKIPNRIFQRMMTEAHHNAPFSQEESIRRKNAAAQEELSDRRSVLEEEEGMLDLAQRRPAPTFVR